MSRSFFSWQTSIRILHSFCLSFVIAFLLDPKIIISYIIIISDLMLFQWIISITLICLTIAQIYFYSGAYSSLIELASEENQIITFEKFHNNALKYWIIFLPIYFLSYLFNFLYFLFLKDQFLSADFYNSYINTVLMILTSVVLLNKKYSAKINIWQIKITAREGLNLLIIFIFFIGVHFIANLFVNFQNLDRLWILFSKYVQFLSFIYISLLILKNYPEITNRFHNNKELVLINPGGGGVLIGMATAFNRTYPPMFVVLKALTPPEYKITEYNRNRWQSHYCKGGKLVAITCYTSNSAEAYKIAKDFKLKGSTVIMGGPHVTFLPEEALQFCDSVVLGEAEGVWPQVIKDYENRCLKDKYVGQPVEAYHAVVHQKLLTLPSEIIKSFLETTRGCKFHCSFCSIPALSSGNVRNKPPLEVVQLLDKIKPKYNSVTFLDNNIYSDPVYAKELFEALKPLKMKWTSFCTIDIAKNEKLLKSAKESGCDMLAIGYEISEKSVEHGQGGKFSMAERYFKYSRKIKEAGIKIRASFIFGFDSDRYKNFLDVWKFCFRIQPSICAFGLLTPFPGTKVFHDMLKENRLTNLNWRYYNSLNMVFKHKYLNERLLSRIFFPFMLFLFFMTTSRLGLVCTFVTVNLIFVYNYLRFL